MICLKAFTTICVDMDSRSIHLDLAFIPDLDRVGRLPQVFAHFEHAVGLTSSKDEIDVGET